jgi:hypothetical protein
MGPEHIFEVDVSSVRRKREEVFPRVANLCKTHKNAEHGAMEVIFCAAGVP